MSSVETEERGVVEVELELSAKKKKTDYNEQRKVYSRESLLSFALSDVSRRLPEGFGHSISSELFEGHDGLIEPWKGSGLLYLPNSSIGGCRVQSILPQSHCNVDREIVGPSTWLKKDKDSSEIHDPDTGRYGKPSEPLLDTTGFEKAEAVAKNSTESGKTSVSLLSKSNNPFTTGCGKAEAVDKDSTESGKTSVSLLSKSKNPFTTGCGKAEAVNKDSTEAGKTSASLLSKSKIPFTTGCEKAVAMDKNSTDSGKTSASLLSKSKNPFTTGCEKAVAMDKNSTDSGKASASLLSKSKNPFTTGCEKAVSMDKNSTDSGKTSASLLSKSKNPFTTGCEKAVSMDKNSTDSGKTSASLLSKSKNPFTAGCEKAEAVDKNSTDSGKTSISLLSKSKNPYRPPHAYKVGSTVFEAKSDAEQNTEVKIIPDDDKQEILRTSKEVMSSCRSSYFQGFLKVEDASTCRGISNGEPASNSNAALEEKVTYPNSEKSVLGTCMDKFNEEQETSSKSSPEISDFLPCSTEKALLPCLAVTCGSENDISGDLTSPSLKCQSLGTIENPEVDRPNKPTADAYLDDTHQRDSLSSKPYEFLIPIGYDYFDSVLREKTTTWRNPRGSNTTEPSFDTWLVNERESEFDDLWSDILAFIRFDQLMEQYQAAESLTSNDYLGSPKEQTVTDNDIQLPDEDSLITVEDFRLPEEESLLKVEDIQWPDAESLVTVEDKLQPDFSYGTESDEPRIDKELPYSHASPPVQPYILIETPIVLSTYTYPGYDQYWCTNVIHQPVYNSKSRSKRHSRVYQSSVSQQHQQPMTSPSLQNQHLLVYGDAHADLVKELVFNNPEMDLLSLTNLNRYV